MKNCQLLVEEGSSDLNEDLVKEFIQFTMKGLKIKSPVNVHLVHSKVPQLQTSGVYIGDNNEIWVRVKNRLHCDIFRSIAHELVHKRQHEIGKLKPNSGDDGSSEENEAHAIAGLIIRKFGKKHPEIYD
jgi:hypothetical protein